MEQYQPGNDQSLARTVSMATEANETAATANAALAQMRRNLGEIEHLYPVINDFHERIAIVYGRVEDTVGHTERLLAERPGTEIGIAPERTQISFGEDGLPAVPDWLNNRWSEPEQAGDDTGYGQPNVRPNVRPTDADSERSEGDWEL